MINHQPKRAPLLSRSCVDCRVLAEKSEPRLAAIRRLRHDSHDLTLYVRLQHVLWIFEKV
jgi:hypothetical protein